MKFNWHYLQTQLAETDVDMLIADCEAWQQTADLTDTERDATRLIQSALMLSAHILPNDKSALAHQLVGRLMRHRATNRLIHSLTDEIAKLPNHLFPVNLDSEYATHIPAGSGFIKIVAHQEQLGWYLIRLRNGQLICYANNPNLYFILEEGEIQKKLSAHKNSVMNYKDEKIPSDGLFQLSDGRILTWAKDYDVAHELFIWSEDGDLLKKAYIDKENHIRKAIELSSGRFITIGEWGYMLLWSPEGDFIAQFNGNYNRDTLENVIELSDGRMVGWHKGYKNSDDDIFLWSSDGNLIHVFEPHFTHFFTTAIQISEDRTTGNLTIIYSSYDDMQEKTFSWNTANQVVTQIQERVLTPDDFTDEERAYHEGLITPSDIFILSDGRQITRHVNWSKNICEIQVWSHDNKLLAQLPNYLGDVEIMPTLTEKRLLMWDYYNWTFFIWDIENTYKPIDVKSTHYRRIKNIGLLEDNRILTYSSEGKDVLCFWDTSGNLLEMFQLDRSKSIWTPPIKDITQYHLPNGIAITPSSWKNVIWNTDETIKHFFEQYLSQSYSYFEYRTSKDIVLGQYHIRTDVRTIIIYHPVTGDIVHTFYGDVFFCTMPIVIENDDDYTIVIGDVRGRVLFLRWREA